MASSMSLPAFLHCSGQASGPRADICWPAGEEAREVIEYCLALHFTINLQEWFQPGATSMAHMDRTRNSPGAISAQTQLLQLYLHVCENIIKLVSLSDGTKCGNFPAMQGQARTVDRRVLSTRQYELLQELHSIREEIQLHMQEEARESNDNDPDSGSSSGSSPHERPVVDEFSDLVGPGASQPRDQDMLAVVVPHAQRRSSNNNSIINDLQLRANGIAASLDRDMYNVDSLLGADPNDTDPVARSDPARRNPFLRLDPAKPVVRFNVELVKKRPDYEQEQAEAQRGEGIFMQGLKPGSDSRCRYDPSTGHLQYAGVNDVISLFDYLGKHAQEPDGLHLAEQSANSLRSIGELLGTAQAPELPKDVKPYELKDRLDEIDSITFSLFTTMGFDPSAILLDIVTAAEITQAELPSSGLCSIVYDAVARQTEQLQVPRPKRPRTGLNDPDVDWRANQNTQEGMERQALRKPTRKQKSGTADAIRDMLVGTSGMTIERYMALAAMYANDQNMMNDWLQRKRETIDGMRKPSSRFHIANVFSFQNAMKQRSPYVVREQSVDAYTEFLLQAIDNPGAQEVCMGYLYTDNIPNAIGVYSFVYPHPEQVLTYNPSAVKASQFLSYPLPHCSVEKRHPLAERCPRLYEELTDEAGGNARTHAQKHRSVHRLEGAYDDSLPEAKRDQLRRHERSLAILTNSLEYTMANMASDASEQSVETYVQGVRELARAPPELRTPFDLSRITHSAVQAAIQELGRRMPVDGEFSHLEVAIDLAKSLSAVVLKAIGNVPGEKRRAALMHSHSRAVVDLYKAECDPHQPDSDAFQAVQWCKLNSRIYSGEKRVRPARMCPHLPAYANLLTFMSCSHYYGSHMLHARHITRMYLLSLTACTSALGLLPNVLLKGDGGVSKSKSMVYVAKLRAGANSDLGDSAAVAQQASGTADLMGSISGHPSRKTTAEKVGDKTENSFTGDQTYLLDHKMLYQEELDAAGITGNSDGNQSNQREQSTSARDKDMRSSSICSKIRLVYQSETGQALMKRFLMVMRTWWVQAMNGSDMNFEDSWHQRFLSIVFPKPKDGEPNPINHVMTAAAMPELMLEGGAMASKADVRRLHNELHCFVADLFNLLEMRAMEPVNECVAWLIIGHLDDWMRKNGGDGLQPRQISMVMDMARILLFQDLYASEVLFPGGRMYRQDWTEHDFLKLDPLLYIAPDHLYTALGMLHTHMCTQGRREMGYAARYYVDNNVRVLSAMQKCKAMTPEKQHYYFTDHLFAVRAISYRDKAQAERSSNGAFGGLPTPGSRLGPVFGQGINNGVREPERGDPDLDKRDYSYFDLDYVAVRDCGQSVQDMCRWLCETLKNTPEVEMIPPVRSLTGALIQLSHTNIWAHPMHQNVPSGPLPFNVHYGIRQTSTTVPLVVPDENQPKKTLPILQLHNGRLLVSTYFLQRDVSNEELMIKAIQTINNHANELPRREVLYSDHEVNPHYRTITVGRFVKPGTEVEDTNMQSNREAFENLRLPNPQRMPQGVKDVMMGGATVGMSPDQQRARVELLTTYRGSPALAQMLHDFERDVMRSKQNKGGRQSKDTNAPSSDVAPKYLAKARRGLEEELGRAVPEGEFDEEVLVCAQYAQTHAYLIRAEQAHASKIELTCPLSDFARQMRAQQINMCAEPITRHDVEFAVDHFAEWQRWCREDDASAITDEERAIFGPWQEESSTGSGFAAMDDLSRPAMITKKKKTQTPVKRDARYGMDAEVAQQQAAASRAEAQNAPDFLTHGMEELSIHGVAYCIDEETGMREMSFSSLVEYDGLRPLPILTATTGPSLLPDAMEDAEQIEATERAEAALAANLRERRVLDTKKRYDRDKPARDQARKDAEFLAQTALTKAGSALVCLPHDWVYDVQMDPSQFCLQNPFFRSERTSDPFFNARVVPDWALTMRPEPGVALNFEHTKTRRALYKTFYAYSPQWQIDRANACDPHSDFFEQRSQYPRYMIEEDAVRHTRHQREKDAAIARMGAPRSNSALARQISQNSQNNRLSNWNTLRQNDPAQFDRATGARNPQPARADFIEDVTNTTMSPPAPRPRNANQNVEPMDFSS